ncbi:DUF4227 family protein [Paenibacillus sp. A14]|uniref:DUF4227 family protein n=1 Tax=Paenibacillus sp. A14 TaxID=3119820 RepID=UPI002FE0A3B4
MVISLRKWLTSVKYALIFMALVYILYQAIGLLESFVFPPDKYRVPEGSAIKVFQSESPEATGVERMADRLKLFFWIGE